jgi:protein phosphatase PTC1
MLILACDGVWDVFSDQEAADLLMTRYLEEGPFGDASEYLVNAAIEKGSADNVTAVVVFL